MENFKHRCWCRWCRVACGLYRFNVTSMLPVSRHHLRLTTSDCWWVATLSDLYACPWSLWGAHYWAYIYIYFWYSLDPIACHDPLNNSLCSYDLFWLPFLASFRSTTAGDPFSSPSSLSYIHSIVSFLTLYANILLTNAPLEIISLYTMLKYSRITDKISLFKKNVTRYTFRERLSVRCYWWVDSFTSVLFSLFGLWFFIGL